MSGSSPAVRLLYGTVPGRMLLKLILFSRADRLAVRFLHSSLSRPMVGWYVRRHNIPLENWRSFRSFREFFIRRRPNGPVDMEPGHLISPCDGWLSAWPIREDSSFFIKRSHYRLKDLVQDEELAREFQGGDCLIFRLCPSDYHRYCYIDDGYHRKCNCIPGTLHSVQPIACETYPVYVLNRRCWTLLVTEHFGPVIQAEIGALVVGGIVNEREHTRFHRGMEKGHFEPAGSTILLLFQKDRIRLLPDLRDVLAHGGEHRVTQGMCIGMQEGLS